MLYVGFCTFCGGGCVGIRVAASGRCIVGMCDECDAVWTNSDLEKGPFFPAQPDLPCPGDGTSLRNPSSHWASREEAVAAGWGHAILGETETYG